MAVVSTLVVTGLPSANSASASAAENSFSPRMLVRVGSSAVIYVVGYGPCAKGLCLELLRTNDNGARFVDRTAPPTKAIKYSLVGSLDELVFANALVGYALEGGDGVDNAASLYATFNGARSWTKVQTPAGQQLSRLAASTSAVYAVMMHCAKQSDGNVACTNYRLVHSSLSATHWTASPLPHGHYSFGFLGNVAAFGSKVWLSEGAKWSLLVSSSNHGASFTTYTPPFPALASVAGCDLTATSASVLWSACPTGMEVSFAHSSDAGTKWNEVPTRQFMGTGGGYFDPVSSNVAYLDYGGSRPLYRVSDAGRHVTDVGTLQCSKVNSSIAAITFTSPREGLAICESQGLSTSTELERTSNGGATWRHIVT
jgi:hypothetical protein